MGLNLLIKGADIPLQKQIWVDKIRQRVEEYEEQIVSFLRDMIRIPSESCAEGEVIERIKEEMESVEYDEVKIDKMGNILGRIGSGKRMIAYDAHVDTVGVGDRAEWKWDPYTGKMEEGIIYGRGAADQKGAMASMVYAGRIIKELGLASDFTIYMVGSVQEEDCDGLCWQFIINEDQLQPELVVITEPTGLNIHLGHRGRMEMEVITSGVSCHGSAPERGENSLYKMAPIIAGVERLNKQLKTDDFLGKGTIAATHIYNETPSLCAIPNLTRLHLDRRLTAGEDREGALSEVERMVKESRVAARLEILRYEKPSYRGLTYAAEKYYPTWVLERNRQEVQSALFTCKALFGTVPELSCWTFSTNGVSIMGRFGIPCIGYGPGYEVFAHSVDDQVPVDHVKRATSFYALFPAFLC